MTKFLTKAALAATVATGLFASPALAADTESFTASARIVKPLALTKTADLNFGTITMLSGLTVTGSKVVVARAGLGGGTTSCGANLNCTTPAPAAFTVTGSAGQDVGITLAMPANNGLLINGTSSVAFVPNAPALATLTGGTASFQIGGEITVTSATVDGTYSNTIDVTVEYN